MKTNPLVAACPRTRLRSWPLLAVFLSLAFVATAPAPTLAILFGSPSSFNEFNPQVILEWQAELGKTYLVQSTDDLAPDAEWKTEEPVTATKAGPIRWMSPESIRERKFYRLVLPQPAIYSVEPAFVNSGDPTALFYIFGQCLPTNGSVVINGLNFTPTQVDSNGTWVAISLNGLPPGTPVIGSILVLDNASNIVATLPLQTPVLYGTEMTAEQLQGPPDEPPASPECSWTKGGGASVGRAEWTKGGGASVGRSAAWTKGGGASVGKPNPGHRSASWTKGGGASVGKANPGRYVASGDGDDDDDDGDGLDDSGFTTLLMPALMKAKEKANRTKCALRPATGEVELEEADLVIPGRGLDFAWTRTYRSRTGTNSVQGAGWDFSYNVSLALQPDGTARLCSGNGRCDTFYPNGTNGWFRDEFFLTVGDLDSDGTPETVTFADTGKWVFRPPVGGDASSGKLAQIVDRNGNTIRCDYDTLSGRLLRVVDTLDRTNSVAYNPAGLIESVTDFSGRIMRYEYDGNGDLTASVSPPVTGTPNGNDFPGGKTNHYAYSSGLADARLNHNLIRCTDAKGQTWLQLIYHATNNPASLDFDAVDFVLRGIDKKDIRRGMVIVKPGYITPLLQTIINDGVGNVTECFYDSRYRPVEIREFTGRANPKLPTTTTENRPTGKLRVDDPDYFETRFEWNADSLCTRITYPRSNSVEMVYQRAFNQNSSRSNNAKSAQHGGDLRLIRERACCDQDDDGDGLVDTLVSTFEYDPRFGSPATVNGKKLYVGNLPFSRSGIPIGNGVAIKTKGTGADANRSSGGPRRKGVVVDSARIITDRDTGRSKGFGFVTSATDPRGIVTTGTYDTNGNCTKVDKRSYTGGRFIIELDGAASYNSHGQLTAITNAADGNGFRRVDTFDYYTNGPAAGFVQSETCDAPGLALTTSYEYDARANVTRVVDARGNDTTFSYNALDQPVHAETPPNTAYPYINVDVALTYDANNNLIRCDEGNRNDTGQLGTNAFWRTEFVYDTLDRMVGCWRDKKGNLVLRCTEVQYDANDNVVLYRSGQAVNGNDPNAVVQCLYDERDLPFQCVAAPGTGQGATEQWDYDGNGNLRVNKIEALVIKQKFYDGFDRCVGATDALGNVAMYAYDRNSNLVYERCDGELNDVAGSTGNRRLSETRYEYDSLDRCVRFRPAFFDVFTELAIGDGEATSSNTYAPNGDCLSRTDDNGHTTRFRYDTVGRLASVTDAKTNVVSFTYDECHNVLSVTRSDRSDLTGGVQQFTVVHGYDRLHRLTRSVDNVGNTNLYAYDSRNYLIRTTDPKGNDTCYLYDGLSRCTDTISYVGPCDAPTGGITISTSHVEYDDNDRVTTSTDSNGNRTQYSYDALDRCVLVTEADGTSSSLIWSPRSNLLRQQDANGNVISNAFDLLDRCVQRNITPASGVAATTTFERFNYDGVSRLVLASNDTSQVEFVFDSLGNCVRSAQDGLVTTATYDGVGNRLAMTYPGGRVVSCAYDALDHPTSLNSAAAGGLPPTVLAQYAYDGPGRLGRIARANNVNTRIQWNGLVNPANPAGDFGWGQVRGVNHQVSGGGPIIDQRVFAYDRSQNKTRRAQTAPFFNGGLTTTNLFAYDALDRLTSFSRASGSPGDLFRAYNLDGNGNRMLGISNGVAAPYIMDNTFPVPADFQMNQYTLTPFVLAPEQYDQNGNLVARVTTTAQLQYVYDYADRLVAVSDLSGGLQAQIVTYAYDALGRRIGKTIYPSGLPPVTTQFIYDYLDDDSDGDIIEERVNGALTRTYVLPQVGDEVLAAFDQTGQPQFYHHDELGNVLALTDAAGAVVERYDYDDYGAPIFLSTDGVPTGETESGVGNRFLFHGQEWDAETGFYHGGSDGAFSVTSKATQGKSGRTKDARRFADPNTGRGLTRSDDGSCAFADNNPWSQRGINGINSGGMPNRISMNITVPKQTQGATFGEKVNAGLHAAGSSISQGRSVGLGGGGGGGGSKAQDHNSSRSNKSGLAGPGGGGGGSGGSRAQDHNSSRSNKSGLAHPGGGGGDVLKQLLYSAKQGKTGSAK